MSARKTIFAYRQADNILLEQYKAIYFPIPKIASSSLKIQFSDLLGIPAPVEDDPMQEPHLRNFPFVDRERIARDYEAYFKFAVVRNPFSRILSCFRNKIYKEGTDHPAYIDGVHVGFRKKYGAKFYQDMSFDAFLEAIAEIPDKEADKHFRSQSVFMSDAKGSVLVDYMAKFENLGEEMLYVYDKLGLPTLALPHLLSSGTGNEYREHYSERGKQIVLERYAADFKILGYTF